MRCDDTYKNQHHQREKIIKIDKYVSRRKKIGVRTDNIRRYIMSFQCWSICTLCFVLFTTKNACNCTCFDADADAKAIKNVVSGDTYRAMASILPYRTAEECDAINKAYVSINCGALLVGADYIPLQATAHGDLFFALTVTDPMTILSKYLGVFLDRKDETNIIMTFILVDDRVKFKEIYNSQHECCFDDARRNQRHPFANALKAWALGNRADVSTTGPTDDSCVQGTWLASEQPHWDDKRDDLEDMLMKHTIDYAKNGIRCYETLNNVQANLINDINRTVKNHDLKDLYCFLTQYIQDRNAWIASKLMECADGRDDWAFWIIILTIHRGDAIKPIDEAFQKLGKKESLKVFISKTMHPDTLFTDSVQAMLDHSFKPFNYIPPPPQKTNPTPPKDHI